MISQNAVNNLAVLKYASQEFTILLLNLFFSAILKDFDFKKTDKKWDKGQNGADFVIWRTKSM